MMRMRKPAKDSVLDDEDMASISRKMKSSEADVKPNFKT